MRNFFCPPLLAFLLSFFWNAGLQAQDPEFGYASVYSDDFQGRKTSYGETYDKNLLTCAHKKHPYGTLLKITRLDNKKSVTCKVTDRGPYVKGRIVDISRKAAETLGIGQEGIVEVKVEIAGRPGREDLSGQSRTSPSREDVKKEKIPDTYSTESPTATTAELSKEQKKTEVATTSSNTGTKKQTPRLVGKDYTQYGLYKIILQRPEKGGFGVQVASLNNYENVLRQVADLQAKSFENVLVSVEKGTDNKSVYKILLGPFDTEASAQSYEASLKKRYKIKGFVVNLDQITY
jgi:rare lipoprotein A